MNDEQLKIKIIADTTDLQKSVVSVERQIDSAGNDVEKSINSISDLIEKSLEKTTAKLGVIFPAIGGALKKAFDVSTAERDFIRIENRLKSILNTTDLDSVSDWSAVPPHLMTQWEIAMEKFQSARRKVGQSADLSIQTDYKAMIGLGQATEGATGALSKFSIVIGVVIAAVTLAIKVIKAFIKAMNEVAEKGSQIYKESQRLGMTIKSYQEWNYILERCGESAKDLESIMNPLVQKISQARKGADTFAALGVAIEDTNGEARETLDIFTDVITQLQQIENKTERAIKAQEIFGQSASKLTPLLNMETESLQHMTREAYMIGYVMSDSAVKIGNQYTMMKNALQASAQSLKNTLGEIFLPYMLAITKVIVKALSYISALFRALAGLPQQRVGADTAKMSDSFSSLGDSINDASNAVKELKRQLMSFDEMNILQSPDNNAFSSTLGALSFGGFQTSGLGDFQLFTDEELNKFEKFQNLLDGIKTNGFISKIKNLGKEITTFAKKCESDIKGFGKSISDWINNTTIEQKIEDIVFGIADFLSPFSLMKNVGNGVISFVNDDMPLLNAINGVVSDITSLVNGGLLGYLTKTSLENLIWKPLTDSIASSPVGASISKWWNDITKYYQTNIAPYLSFSYWFRKLLGVSQGTDTTGNNVFDSIIRTGGKIISWFKTNISPYLTFSWWDTFLSPITTAFDSVGTFLKKFFPDTWNAIVDFYKKNIQPFLPEEFWIKETEPFNSAISETLNDVQENCKNAQEKIDNYYKNKTAPKISKTQMDKNLAGVRDSVNDTLNTAKSSFIDSWKDIDGYYDQSIAPQISKSSVSKKGSGFVDGVKEVINKIITKVEQGVNFIIRQLNKLKISVPDWVPGIGGEHWGVNLREVSIPRLAQGGIATKSVLANIGENGAEAVLPLENNTGWMDMLAAKLITPQTIVLKVGETELGRATIRGINNITRQTGALQLQLV